MASNPPERVLADPAILKRPAPKLNEALVLQMVGISKEFWGTRVLHDVDFSLARGEVHALVGQNGAGKSTLIKILGGVFRDYRGSIWIDGAPVVLRDPRTAIAAGVATIYQDFTLVPYLTVAENIMLGREPSGRVPGSLHYRQLRSTSMREAERLGINLPMSTPAALLGVATQQLTEIVKAVSRHARILVMDEPTARLSAKERDRLFAIMRDLTATGVGIVYISHFLEEIFAVADRVTVLRDGRVVSQSPAGELDLTRLTELMTRGRSGGAGGHRKSTAGSGMPALKLEEFGVPGRVGPVSLEVGHGEIVGLAGLVGSGRTTLARAIAGASGHAVGSIATPLYSGRPRHPAEAAAAGILLLTEDRKREGIIGVRSVGENVAITALGRTLSRFGIVRARARAKLVGEMIARLGIVPRNPSVTASSLSGGNQQKVVFARAIAAGARLLILDQPTAGVDISAKADLYEQISRLAHDGVGILLISDELDELLNLSDRIAVFSRGRMEEVSPADAYDRAGLLQAITTGASSRRERSDVQ
jgi:ABC-type sugar transport system ATPase subunit